MGGFFSGCNQSLLDIVSKESKVRFRGVKAFQSTGDKDSIVDESQIERVAKGLKSGGIKKIRSKTFPGGHNTNPEHFKEALDWFAEEE